LDPSSSNIKPKPNKLILPSIILGCIPALAIPFAIIFPHLQFYMFFLLPFGLIAALLARIALNQIKRGSGTSRERSLAIAAYFLGLSPVLYFCGIFTFQLLNL
jgi:ABC-type Na+ efflux pump permease subunit